MNDFNKKIILVAEDEEMNFLLIQESLKNMNIELLRARTGNEAVEIFAANKDIKLVLMDVKMPGMNGYEATKIIKSLRNVPVIVQTAYAMVNEKAESEQSGCDDYITKPIQISKLISLVNRYLSIN